jgi:opine dehydrogenase
MSRLIERTKGDFDFYHQGVTPAVGRLVEGVDRERIAIGKKLGVEVIPDPELGVIQGYMTEATYDNGFNTAPGFAGVKAQAVWITGISMKMWGTVWCSSRNWGNRSGSRRR